MLISFLGIGLVLVSESQVGSCRSSIKTSFINLVRFCLEKLRDLYRYPIMCSFPGAFPFSSLLMTFHIFYWFYRQKCSHMALRSYSKIFQAYLARCIEIEFFRFVTNFAPESSNIILIWKISNCVVTSE